MPSLRLPKGAKPSKALSRSKLRPVLTRAYVAQPNGRRELIASNSFILARLPVADDVPLGPISPEALKRIEKGEKHTITDSGVVRFEGADGTPIEYHAPEQTEMPFARALDAFAPDGHQVVSVGLNADLLKALSDSIGGSGSVRLDIRVHEDGMAIGGAVRVTPLGGDAQGLLMPIRLDA